jgi:putative transposase
MRASQGKHAISTMCRALDVSECGYHAWRKRPPSKRATADAALTTRIRAIHTMSDGTYGAPRIREELADVDGLGVGTKRIARLMRRIGLQGVSGRAFVTTTVRDEKAKPAPDLVDRRFEASGPNQLWVSDITYVPTWAGFLFLAVVIDVWSRKVVGWSMATHLKTELVIAALDMAIAQRQPSSVVSHSDQGSQYTSVAYGQRCREAGVQPSMGTVGDAYDNAMCESFFASLEKELIDRRTFRSHAEGRMALFRYIEGWYNPSRRHSGIDYNSPNNYELKNKKAA